MTRRTYAANLRYLCIVLGVIFLVTKLTSHNGIHKEKINIKLINTVKNSHQPIHEVTNNHQQIDCETVKPGQQNASDHTITLKTPHDCLIMHNMQKVPLDIGGNRWLISPRPTEIPTSVLDTWKMYMQQFPYFIISFIDESYLDMALNFYEDSILRHEIKNFMFISQSSRVCRILFTKGILCVLYKETDKVLVQDTAYGSKLFKNKMGVRANLELHLLKNNISFLLTDVDNVFVKVCELAHCFKGLYIVESDFYLYSIVFIGFYIFIML